MSEEEKQSIWQQLVEALRSGDDDEAETLAAEIDRAQDEDEEPE